MDKFLEFKIIDTDVYCREVAIGNISGNRIILTDWYFYINTECC